MTIIITLSFAGNETGPFDLYSDATGFAIPFAQNVSKAALLAGYQVEAPDGTAALPIKPSSVCTSASIVGFPLESRIWRAVISIIALM